jgi:hypothetical protein
MRFLPDNDTLTKNYKSNMSGVQERNPMPNVSEIQCGMHDDGVTAGSIQSKISSRREFCRSVIRSEGHERMGCPESMGGSVDDRN